MFNMPKQRCLKWPLSRQPLYSFTDSGTEKIAKGPAQVILSRVALEDRVAIVTGAGRNIGKSIALGLADAGADVVVAARTAAATWPIRGHNLRCRKALIISLLRPALGSTTSRYSEKC